MKKIMWIVAVLPVVVASMMLQVIPDMIPHKIGIFIFPIVILCVTFFWHLLIGTFEKKTVKGRTIAGYHVWNYELLYPLFLLCAGKCEWFKGNS